MFLEIKKNMHIGILFLLCIFFSGCGLEVVSFIYGPTVENESNNEDVTMRVFNFLTADSINNTEPTFTGTTIFYRIYNNYSKMIQDINTINNYNTDSVDVGFNKMQSLHYVEMQSSNQKILGSPLFKRKDMDTQVEVRLYTEGAYKDDPYTPFFSFGDRVMDSNGKTVVPLRAESSKSFQFYDYDTENPTDDFPLSNDVDVEFDSNSQTVRWYVAAYAVSTGFISEDYVNYYSQLTYLGYIVIKPESVSYDD